MEVSVLEIVEIFERLISNELTREEASDWATMRMKAHDSAILEFKPPSNEQVIWRAILYLQGVDLKTSPDSYLHSSEEFTDYISANLQQ
jgi:hypothetical protein